MSRLLASILILSSKVSGSRSEIVLVEGFSLLINSPLFTVHVATGSHSDQSTVMPECERNVEQPLIIRYTKGMKTSLSLAVLGVIQYQKRLVKENFFCFELVSFYAPDTGNGF